MYRAQFTTQFLLNFFLTANFNVKIQQSAKIKAAPNRDISICDL